MIKSNLLAAAALLAALAASPAHAGIPRAWVSGHGTDAAGCGSGIDPCRSLQYVVSSIIAPGGEIDIQDPAAYGAVTIPFALSIVNDGVGTAGVQEGAAGQNAITITAGPNDNVTLRGLNIDGLGTGANGIVFNSGGSLSIVNCVIRHFASGNTDTVGKGILIQPASVTGSMNFLVSNTIVADNGNVGIYYLLPTGTPTVYGLIDHVTATNNQFGMVLDAGSQNTGATTVTITNSIASNNGTGLSVQNGNNIFTVTVDLSTFDNNINTGIQGNGAITLMLSRSIIASNTAGTFNNTSSNTFDTFGNNQIYANSRNITGNSLISLATQ